MICPLFFPLFALWTLNFCFCFLFLNQCTDLSFIFFCLAAGNHLLIVFSQRDTQRWAQRLQSVKNQRTTVNFLLRNTYEANPSISNHLSSQTPLLQKINRIDIRSNRLNLERKFPYFDDRKKNTIFLCLFIFVKHVPVNRRKVKLHPWTLNNIDDEMADKNLKFPQRESL